MRNIAWMLGPDPVHEIRPLKKLDARFSEWNNTHSSTWVNFVNWTVLQWNLSWDHCHDRTPHLLSTTYIPGRGLHISM